MGASSYGGTWDLAPADRLLIEAKHWGNRPRFAIMLLFFRARGRFPRTIGEISEDVMTGLARTLGVPAPDGTALLPSTSDRTLERQRAEIRVLLGFREATVADAEELGAWLRDHAVAETRDHAVAETRDHAVAETRDHAVAETRDHAVAETRDHGRLTACLEERCRALRIEPPTPDRVGRIVRSAVRAYEDRLFATIHARLPPEVRERLDALLRPPPAGTGADGEDDPAAAEGARALLNFVRGDPGKAGVASVTRGLERLEAIRAVGLPADLFAGVLPHEVELCRRRVAVQPPSDLRRLPEPVRLAWLAAYAHRRGRALTDDLVELLVETVHAIGARAERRVEQQVIGELKRVTGKTNLLFEIAGAAVARPDGTVRDVVFPVVGEQTLRDLVRERQSGPTYRTSLRTTIRSSYAGHYRRMVPRLLDALDFRSNNAVHRPVIEALALVRRYAGTRVRHIPAHETVPIEGVVRPLWRGAVIDAGTHGKPRVNRITYEICVLETLRERLRSKEIWVVGADRYRNPDEDLPADFAERRTPYYEALGLPLDADAFVAGLQDELRAGLSRLDAGLPRNPRVRITSRRGGWITVSPLQARPKPESIEALKAEVAATWPMTSLLDIIKETDRRLGFTDALGSPTAYETLDRDELRLLLCLYGLGTNTGLRRLDAARDGGPGYRDLAYARRRYLTPDRLREAIAVVTNGTLRARDPTIWGEGTTACASDSKHFGAWDQNLTTQWHVRYGGRGVMIYWHVERNSLCIHSQLKSPSSSEVASMIEGVLRHCTEMAVDRQYVDSHRQSVVAFASTKLLGFQLLPRLKRIGKQRLYRPDAGQADAYARLQPVLSRPIGWDLIRRQYDEMVKYATALRLGTAEAEAILRRFNRENVQHPTYKALLELGKAVKTCFLCRYLADEAPRREVNDGLNVVEHWNSANDFVFFARRGEMSSNRAEDHELSMLSLHLLQNCMVFVNTLMLQQVLARPHWAERLTARDRHALTPLFWEHVNPYGRQELDMRTRIAALG
jgi:TnpA family transposase